MRLRISKRGLGPSLAAALAALFVAGPAAGQDAPDGPIGPADAVARADLLVEAMGGAYIWSLQRSFRQRMVQSYVGARDRMIEHEYLDLVEPRTRFEMRSEIYEQQRATSPAGGWMLRNGEFTAHSPEQVARSLRGAAGSLYRIVRRIAANDPTLHVRFAADRPHRLEFLDAAGEMLCYVVVDVAGEPVQWGRSDVEWVFGPLVRFGNIRVPGWGAYTNGDWRYNVLDASVSMQPPEVSFDPPAAIAPRAGNAPGT